VASALPHFAAAEVVGFLLVLARVGGLFVLAPVFSARMIPLRARLLLAGAIALALLPLATHGQAIPEDAASASMLIVKEAAVGLAFAFPMAVLTAAIQAGAGLVDSIVGFSFASLVDPVNNQQNGVLGQFSALVAVMVFLLAGGDHLMIEGLAASYRVLPLTAAPDMAHIASHALDTFGDVWLIGLEIAGPVVLALVVTDAALGLVSRAVPQMNVFAIGMPAKILVGLALLGASLPFISNQLQVQLEQSVAAAVHMVGG
jgi:flagellar biosynthetic protein FliR